MGCQVGFLGMGVMGAAMVRCKTILAGWPGNARLRDTSTPGRHPGQSRPQGHRLEQDPRALRPPAGCGRQGTPAGSPVRPATHSVPRLPPQQVGSSIQEVVQRSSITFAIVSDPAAARAVAAEVARHISPGAAARKPAAAPLGCTAVPKDLGVAAPGQSTSVEFCIKD